MTVIIFLFFLASLIFTLERRAASRRADGRTDRAIGVATSGAGTGEFDVAHGGEPARREARRSMAQACELCIVASRDTLGVELDHTLESLARLDAALTSADLSRFRDEPEAGDAIVLLAAYWGDVVRRNSSARWTGASTDQLAALVIPDLTFSRAGRTVSPGEVMRAKLTTPDEIDISEIARRLIEADHGVTSDRSTTDGPVQNTSSAAAGLEPIHGESSDEHSTT